MNLEASAFKEALGRLNDAQRQAVEHIDGPMLIIAGPGTGKTELLAMRVGNILQKTDVSPQNILCLTFTESAKSEMQARLANLIRQDGYKVAVHTFHSFGAHVMGSYGDYFAEAFGFRPADELRSYQIISNLLQHLPSDNPLAKTYGEDYLYIKDIKARISQFRSAGVTADELRRIVASDQKWAVAAEGIIQKELGQISRMKPADIGRFEELANRLKIVKTKSSLAHLSHQLIIELKAALEASHGGKTRSLTNWKNKWLSKNSGGFFILKCSKQLNKLSALAEIYKEYSLSLKQDRLFDFDDMILNVYETLRNSPELLAELQEQYQYILVDEYQDCSGAQIKLLNLLSESPANEGKPNLMAVGDDDQAIYSFQGAYSSNLLDFIGKWRSVKKIVLTRNYRSTPGILSFVRSVIVQGESRLENSYPELNKLLTANKTADSVPNFHNFGSAVDQYLWISKRIKKQVGNGVPASQIAVLAPKHKHLEVLVPFLLDAGVPLAYEKRENVLTHQHVAELIHLSRVVNHLAHGEINLANALLPELLSFPWWGVEPWWLWELSLESKKSGQPQWLELMRNSKNKTLKQIADWLVEAAALSVKLPLELMLDHLIGTSNSQKGFDSPFRRYYFDQKKLKTAQIDYLRLLSSLISLRTHLRNYRPNESFKLDGFVDFVDLRLKADLKILNDHPLVLERDCVLLMTAHKAKGQEFEHVYVINSDEHTWVSEKGRVNKIALPPNYAVTPDYEGTDEKLRLFYVAASRAKSSLTLSSYDKDDTGKTTLPLGWTSEEKAKTNLKFLKSEASGKPSEQVRGLGFDWRTPHFNLTKEAKWRDLLRPTLDEYTLNPTHLNAFLNVPKGGPRGFLVEQLLRFPKAESASASFGSAMHGLMRKLHFHYNEKGKLPAHLTAVRWLAEELARFDFEEVEAPKQLHRGHQALEAIYKDKSLFKKGQLAEKNFIGEGVLLGSARLSGEIDSAVINKADKTMHIIDYKTGKSYSKWPSSNIKINSSNTYELEKLHSYRRQLMFYKLLVEGSRTYGGQYKTGTASLIFIEPDEENQLRSLDITYDNQELAKFKKLVQVVWQKIMAVDLPDTSKYPPDYTGVLQFESDLLSAKI